MSMHFDLTDLRVFLAVTEENSFTAGAERAHLSVPSASTRIKHLEQNMGSKLLLRGSNGVSLTPEGETFFHHAQSVMDAVGVLRDAMAQYTEGKSGTVNVVANTTAASEFLPQDVRAFLVAHPSINLILRERHPEDVLRAVTDGKADIGVVVGDVHSTAVDLFPYRTDRLVLAVAQAHPLASRDAVLFAETTSYDFIGMPDASSIRGFLQREALKLKARLRVRIEVANYAALCRLIEANAGVSVLPRSVALHYIQDRAIVLVPLHDAWALRRHMLCTRSGEALTVSAQALLTHLKHRPEQVRADDNLLPPI